MCEVDCVFRNFPFRVSAIFSRFFDDMAVLIAGRKIHPCIHVAGIIAQRLLDQTHGFNEFAPVHRTKKSQAGDAVADRDLG